MLAQSNHIRSHIHLKSSLIRLVIIEFYLCHLQNTSSLGAHLWRTLIYFFPLCWIEFNWKVKWLKRFIPFSRVEAFQKPDSRSSHENNRAQHRWSRELKSIENMLKAAPHFFRYKFFFKGSDRFSRNGPFFLKERSIHLRTLFFSKNELFIREKNEALKKGLLFF